jgi:hypothetical protein
MRLKLQGFSSLFAKFALAYTQNKAKKQALKPRKY